MSRRHATMTFSTSGSGAESNAARRSPTVSSTSSGLPSTGAASQELRLDAQLELLGPDGQVHRGRPRPKPVEDRPAPIVGDGRLDRAPGVDAEHGAERTVGAHHPGRVVLRMLVHERLAPVVGVRRPRRRRHGASRNHVHRAEHADVGTWDLEVHGPCFAPMGNTRSLPDRDGPDRGGVTATGRMPDFGKCPPALRPRTIAVGPRIGYGATP